MRRAPSAYAKPCNPTRTRCFVRTTLDACAQRTTEWPDGPHPSRSRAPLRRLHGGLEGGYCPSASRQSIRWPQAPLICEAYPVHRVISRGTPQARGWAALHHASGKASCVVLIMSSAQLGAELTPAGSSRMLTCRCSRESKTGSRQDGNQHQFGQIKVQLWRCLADQGISRQDIDCFAPIDEGVTSHGRWASRSLRRTAIPEAEPASGGAAARV